MRIRVVEAVLPTSELSKKCLPHFRDILGVAPFPDGEDKVYLKAVYFNHSLKEVGFKVLEDAVITVSDEAIVLDMRVSCDPNQPLRTIHAEKLSSSNPFTLAIEKIANVIAEKANGYNKDWCRIGNYKTLVIEDKFLATLKAFYDVYKDELSLTLPKIAIIKLNEAGDSIKDNPNYIEAYKMAERLKNGGEDVVDNKFKEEMKTMSDFERLAMVFNTPSQSSTTVSSPTVIQDKGASKQGSSRKKKTDPRFMFL